ncbi:MAG: VPGUxxT family thioredoxin-like (seleno)protein, type 2 [Verrucomicrobiota bacterium]
MSQTFLKPSHLICISIALAVFALPAQAETHKELGAVNWLRDYDEAIELAESTGKPILILFQEVPGCHGCVQYGQTTLSHPLIVDAIENAFVPLAIFNNQAGPDREILKRFDEPAWNFQVMRFIDREGKDIIPRKDRVWTPEATAARMVESLEKVDRPVPDYLRTVAWRSKTDGIKTAAFSMYCFWDGEAKLGGIDGVLETESGWLDGAEVVKLSYDSDHLQWPELVKKAKALGCAERIYAPDSEALKVTSEAKLYPMEKYRKARESDQKRHLQFSKLKTLPLNPFQKTKINSALSQRDVAVIQQWLSPSQLESL